MAGLFVEFNAGKRGRPRKFSPQQLLDKFQEYIDDRLKDPIIDEETEHGSTPRGSMNVKREKPHPQLLSILDFCVYLGTSRQWWNALSEDYLVVKTYISTYLENYQLKGASAGVFNANIVARLIGLADKKEISAGENVTVIVHTQEEKEKIDNMGNLQV